MEKSILNKIRSVKDVNTLSLDELKTLCEEIRGEIIGTVEKNGGHLSSALGAVEAIVALCSVYDFSADKIFFDVGHQSYAFKLLSVGAERFSTIRTEGGLSGFCGDDKKAADGFIGGHAGNSLSAASGYLYARDKKGGDENVIVFVGDASLFNGENLEALFVNAEKPKKMLIVFNDNGMSISENRNGAYKFFSRLALKRGYGNTKNFLHKILGNRLFARCLKRLKSNFKHSVSPATVLDEVGMKYFGVFDGHDLKSLCSALKEIKSRGKPCFLHIKTKKGKGFECAENDPECYHGIGGGLKTSRNDFSSAVSDILSELAEQDDKVFAITAGMKSGTGLSGFAEKYPDRFVDVGICEEYAVTFAAGSAYNGLKPVVCIYSTFLQRAYDQIITDVCMQNLPVVFMLDRAGFVGADGKTHQGLFDLSYLRAIPNLTVLAPKDTSELKLMLGYALSCGAPVAIRYSNGSLNEIETESPFDLPGRWEILKDGDRLAIFAVGNRMNTAALRVGNKFGSAVAVINARSVKPLDEDMLRRYAHIHAIVLEENVSCGGFGESIAACRAVHGGAGVTTFSAGDDFCEHASIGSQLAKNGLDEDSLSDVINELLKK